jgi:hypothetical protein
MLYQKEIDDSVLIQFIILFTLNNADSPLPYNELLNLVLDNCNINFNDFQIALVNLVSTGHVHAYLEGPHLQKYEVTPKGQAAGDFFKTHIPVYIREPIQQSIKDMFREERLKHAIRSNIYPIKHDEYSAECELYDDDNTRLMNLSLYAGSREEAEKLAEYFRHNAYHIYDGIINLFSNENHEDQS